MSRAQPGLRALSNIRSGFVIKRPRSDQIARRFNPTNRLPVGLLSLILVNVQPGIVRREAHAA